MNRRRLTSYFFVLAILWAMPVFLFANTSGYAWGENVGWIDFANVIVSDSELSGYAYSSNIGWISFSCENTSSCGDSNYRVLNNDGDLSGHAWAENIGWIDFGSVTIDPETGIFDGYAYSSNIGWIFLGAENGNLITDWRKEDVGGGGGGGSSGITQVIGSINPIPIVVQAITTSCDNDVVITDNLTYGSRDGHYHEYNKKVVTQVSQLQSLTNNLLIEKYEKAAGSVDGIFGSLTKQGVQRLQQYLNGMLKNSIPLVIDGIVGPLTKNAINNICESKN